jgi:uncharacterized membrane-anchored protein
MLHIQGKYVVQVAEYLQERFGIPSKHMQVRGRGVLLLSTVSSHESLVQPALAVPLTCCMYP